MKIILYKIIINYPTTGVKPITSSSILIRVVLFLQDIDGYTWYIMVLFLFQYPTSSVPGSISPPKFAAQQLEGSDSQAKMWRHLTPNSTSALGGPIPPPQSVAMISLGSAKVGPPCWMSTMLYKAHQLYIYCYKML